MIIDSHAHLYLNQFDEDRHAVIRRCVDNDVKKILLPNIDSTTIEAMLEMENAYSGTCFPMMGLHPCSVGDNPKSELETVEHWLRKRHFCAVGEIGIDLHWQTDNFEAQKRAFVQQIEWAIELKKPRCYSFQKID